MSQAVAAALLLLFAGALAAVALRGRPGAGRVGAALLCAGCGVTAVLLSVAALRREPPNPPQPGDLPRVAAAEGYATADSCRSCHPRQHATWHASFHRTMTQTASRESVLGDFEDVRLSFGDVHYWLYQRDGRFFGEVDSPRRAAPRTLDLVQTTGSHHMQVYWTATGEGRQLEAFPLVFLRGEERWIPRVSAFVTPPRRGDAPTSVWNTTCIGCHTTRPRPELGSGPGDPPDSAVSDLGIACEACHGPGEEHVELHRAPWRRLLQRASPDADESIVNPARLEPERASQVCGQCHAVKTFRDEEHALAWSRDGSDFVPGDDLEATFTLVSRETLNRPYLRAIRSAYPDFVRGSFWPDGIVRVTGREYNAIRQSGCFQRGEISCLSCHSLHPSPGHPEALSEWADDQLAAGMDSDRACLQCHASYESAEALGAHTRHPVESSGSRCLNCHMPHSSYGLLKAVRAHQIDSPRVVTRGPARARPNACNLCHLDRSLGWAAESLAREYGQPLPPLSEDDRSVPAGARWALEGDAGVRALVAWSMGWEPAREASDGASLVPYLAELMQDPYDAVRLIAHRSARGRSDVALDGYDPLAPAEARAAALAPLRRRGLDAAERTLFERLLSQRDTRPLNLAE